MNSNNNNNASSTTQNFKAANNQSNSPSTSGGSIQYETYQTFDWDFYLKETNSTAAPLECFKQVQRRVQELVQFFLLLLNLGGLDVIRFHKEM